MASKSRFSTVDAQQVARPLFGAPCQCLAEFFGEEFRRHHRCLEQHREYYSEDAIAQAEAALARILQELEGLCLRDDACEVIGQLLRQFDSVTQLSLLTEPRQLH